MWIPLREKCPNTEFFLVRIFLYSVQIQENTDQKKLRSWTLFMQCTWTIYFWNVKYIVLKCNGICTVKSRAQHLTKKTGAFTETSSASAWGICWEMYVSLFHKLSSTSIKISTKWKKRNLWWKTGLILKDKAYYQNCKGTSEGGILKCITLILPDAWSY